MEKEAMKKTKRTLLSDYLDMIVDNKLPLPDYIKLDRTRPSADSLPEPEDHVLLRLDSKSDKRELRENHGNRYQLVSYDKNTTTVEFEETVYIDNFDIKVAYFNRNTVYKTLKEFNDDLSGLRLINAIEHGSDGDKILNENIVVRIILNDSRCMDFICRLKPNHDLVNIATTNGKCGGAVLPLTRFAFEQFNEMYQIKGIISADFEKPTVIKGTNKS